jgi:hypothetical protein
VCCAGPIFAVVAAIGLSTVVGVAIFGVAGLLVALFGVTVLLQRRRRRCGDPAVPVPIPPPNVRARR